MQHADPSRLRASFIAMGLTATATLVGCGDAVTATMTPPTGADSGVTADAAPTDARPADVAPTPAGLAVLGRYRHTVASVQLTVIGTDADHLQNPSDVAFNPEAPEQLWVTNRATPSIVIFTAPGTADQAASLRTNPRQDGGHFLAHPAAMAFGAPGNFATAPDENQVTQPSTPANFMGPTLWSSDTNIFDGGMRSHLDMLHNSPSSGGIAWDRANIYWIFDGAHHSLTRYDFHRPHVLGGTDHSDGEIARFVEGQVSRVTDVVSHMEIDHTTGLLYVADTGNHRIVALDTASGTRGSAMGPNYDGGSQYRMMDATLTTIVDSSVSELQSPAGLALHDRMIFVSDNASSRLYAFDLMGHVIDWLDLSGDVMPGALQGIAFDADGALYVADGVGNRVLKVSPRTP